MKQIPFFLEKIETLDYAAMEDAYIEDGTDVTFGLNISFGTKSPEDCSLVCVISILFKQDDRPFLKIKSASVFSIDPTYWKQQIVDRVLTLPKKIADHLSVLSLGTTRGILHAKTEGTLLNKFLIPQLNISKYFKNDVTISFSK